MAAEELSPQDLISIDSICDRFESAWRTGDPPDIHDYLDFDGQKRATLLAELVQIDKACRERKGTQVDIEIYTGQFAEHAEAIRHLNVESEPAQIALVANWRLEVIGGPHVGLTQVLPGTGELQIGRSSTNHLSLVDDPRCSRKHAILQYAPTGCTVFDAGSKNGVFVNGTKTQQANIRPGDTLTVGQTHIQVHADDAPGSSDSIADGSDDRSQGV